MTDNLYFEQKYRTLMEDNQQNKTFTHPPKFIKKHNLAVAGTSAWIAGCKDEQKSSNGPPSKSKNLSLEYGNYPGHQIFRFWEKDAMLAKFVEEASEGQMKINVYGGGETDPSPLKF